MKQHVLLCTLLSLSLLYVVCLISLNYCGLCWYTNRNRGRSAGHLEHTLNSLPCAVRFNEDLGFKIKFKPWIINILGCNKIVIICYVVKWKRMFRIVQQLVLVLKTVWLIVTYQYWEFSLFPSLRLSVSVCSWQTVLLSISGEDFFSDSVTLH